MREILRFASELQNSEAFLKRDGCIAATGFEETIFETFCLGIEA